MKHADWCRSRQPQGFCNCKPKAKVPNFYMADEGIGQHLRELRAQEAWHNVTTESLFKSLIPGWKADGK